MTIRIIENKCKGCGICLNHCPFDALTMENSLAVVGPSCTSCRVCIEKCPFDAIELIEVEKEKVDLSSFNGVWVFAEQRNNQLMPVVFELLGEGKRLAKEIGTELSAIVCGEDLDMITKELLDYGADKVYVADNKQLKNYRTDSYTKVINEAIEKYKPEIVLLGATHIGRDLGPCLAVKANTGLTADCTEFEIDPKDKKLKQTRPAFGGNLMATIVCPDHRPQMSTVRPGVMIKPESNNKNESKIVNINVSFTNDDMNIEILEEVKEDKSKISIEDANVLI